MKYFFFFCHVLIFFSRIRISNITKGYFTLCIVSMSNRFLILFMKSKSIGVNYSSNINLPILVFELHFFITWISTVCNHPSLNILYFLSVNSYSSNQFFNYPFEKNMHIHILSSKCNSVREVFN